MEGYEEDQSFCKPYFQLVFGTLNSESFAPETELSNQIWTKRIEALKQALKTNNVGF